jgi:hypothetical protein
MTKEVKIKGGSAMSSPVVRSTNVLKRKSMRFVAALLVVVASFVAGPNAALAAPQQHHSQVPGFYRLKVGDLFSSMRVPAAGGVGEYSGVWRAASAAQATLRKKSTSF